MKVVHVVPPTRQHPPELRFGYFGEPMRHQSHRLMEATDAPSPAHDPAHVGYIDSDALGVYHPPCR